MSPFPFEPEPAKVLQDILLFCCYCFLQMTTRVSQRIEFEREALKIIVANARETLHEVLLGSLSTSLSLVVFVSVRNLSLKRKRTDPCSTVVATTQTLLLTESLVSRYTLSLPSPLVLLLLRCRVVSPFIQRNIFLILECVVAHVVLLIFRLLRFLFQTPSLPSLSSPATRLLCKRILSLHRNVM